MARSSANACSPPIAATGNKRGGPGELRPITFGVIPDDAPHLDRSEHHAIAAGDLTSHHQVLRLMAEGLQQIIHRFEAFVRCCPFDELTWAPARVGDP